MLTVTKTKLKTKYESLRPYPMDFELFLNAGGRKIGGKLSSLRLIHEEVGGPKEHSSREKGAFGVYNIYRYIDR
jgi:hypothetical protein